MTALHLFTAYQFQGNLSLHETIAKLLKYENSYLQLDLEVQFHFKGFVYESLKFDVIILELDVPKGCQLPPPLPLMSQSDLLDSVDSHNVTIMGFDGNAQKRVDRHCLTVQVAIEECRLARQHLQQIGFRGNWYNGKRYDGEWYSDLAEYYLLPVRTHFRHGASGAPVVVEYKGKPLVIAMLTKGYPEFYWDIHDEHKLCIDPKFIIQAAVWLMAVSPSIKEQNPHCSKEMYGMDDFTEDSMEWSET
ncbi:uncharacterized protein [Haliotis cracherodii]